MHNCTPQLHPDTTHPSQLHPDATHHSSHIYSCTFTAAPGRNRPFFPHAQLHCDATDPHAQLHPDVTDHSFHMHSCTCTATPGRNAHMPSCTRTQHTHMHTYTQRNTPFLTNPNPFTDAPGRNTPFFPHSHTLFRLYTFTCPAAPGRKHRHA
ncbi:hypothetical protein BgiMline_029776 [Biomphalaria glabrata]|nr:hypothetical protein BgiMline_026493 [Biomphalaria glabrata]